MTLQQKFPNTSTFTWYNANPKGKVTSDCVIRALATGMGKDYNQVVMDLATLQCKTGYDDGDKRLYGKYLEMNGWIKQQQPRKDDGTKFTGEMFCKYLQCDDNDKNIIAHIGGHHIVAIVNNKVYDTWDSTDGCIGNFWVQSK